MKTKHLFIAATAILAFASCSSDDFVGDKSLQDANGTGGAITFTSGTPAVTRAVGAEAADLLNKNFVVYGYKTVSSTPQLVFDNYQVNWATNTAGTSETNSADWEYVGYKNLPVGVSTNVGVTAFSALTGASEANETAIDQSIKYWDYSASAYDFFAYSLGKGSSSTWAKASALAMTGYGDSDEHPGYTLEGTGAQLATCYISNKNTVEPSVSATQVNLEFRSFLSQIELKFYETIPGYSVKSLSFYPSSTGVAGTTPYLFAGSGVLPIGGKYTVTFDETTGQAQLTFDTGATPDYASNIAFSETLTGYAAKDYKEANVANTYIGRASNAATSTDLVSVLPNPQNTNALNLKIDFTLVSRDGTGETINMTGATAVIPATYAKWQPNYKYTYIFKISDNTNALSGSVQGLYPITLDAVVTNAVDDGTQTTITTVATPSITTYQKGHVATSNEYKLPTASTDDKDDIYVQVWDITNDELVSDLNTKSGEPAKYTKSFFYSLSEAKTEAEVMDALNIQEGVDAGVITGRNGLTLTPKTTIDNTVTAIPGEDGHDITVAAGEAAKVTPDAAGTYAYVYLVSAGDATSIYSAQELSSAPTDWDTSNNIYYSNPDGSGQLTGDFATPSFDLTAEPADWVASSANVYYSNATCTDVISGTFESLHVFTQNTAPTDWVASEENLYYSDDACTTKITTAYANPSVTPSTKPDDWVDGDSNIYYTDATCETKATGAFVADQTYYKMLTCYKKVHCYKKLICYKKYTDLNNTYAVKVIKVVEP